ncbi:hypothetical protein AMTR_s00041p00235950 [Amborella trichopoda]|uniref:BURP domain-containing protein n=1 Tax=Amborella trichopoda TaxID=13333 RepID=W1Q0N4_AMBTC|nr:hypothetical protein AMTR_s00041p00235950 [Amborella trichopoda]
MGKLPLASALLLLAEGHVFLGSLNYCCVLATPESYWACAFSNTPIPDIIHARLRRVPSGLLYMGSGGLDPRFWYSDFTEEHRDPRVTTLYLEEELKVGMKMVFHFRKSDIENASPFLSREDADAIPFSSAKPPRFLQHFSIPLASTEASE